MCCIDRLKPQGEAARIIKMRKNKVLLDEHDRVHPLKQAKKHPMR
jgi:hypothetical protein